MKKLLSLALFCYLFTAQGMGQSIDFVPQGIFQVKTQYQQGSYSEVYQRRNVKVSLLTQKLIRYGIEETEVTGELSESQSSVFTEFTYGLGVNWNLGFAMTQITKSRASDLTLASGASSAAQNFVSEYKAQDLSGSGDSQVTLSWRFSFTDVYDFRFDTTYFHNDGVTQYDDASHYSLGNGTSEVEVELFMDFYSTKRRSIFQTRSWMRYPSHAEVTGPNGESQSLRLGQALGLDFSWVEVQERWFYAFGLEGTQRSPSFLGGTHFYDEGNNIDFVTSVGFGNLHQLEGGQSPSLPWDGELSYVQTVAGINGNVFTGIKAAFNFYF